ncbi:FAD-binding domain-containing protein, partial [Stipitochalara longipes BDJ]
RYWSRFQSQVLPGCIVYPLDAVDIASILNILTANSCMFAVLAGGTSPWAGASTITGGTIIDLERLRNIQVANTHDLPAVVVGAGNRWADVYRTLDSFNLSVAGTRNGSPGVSGSVLGGGISFFSQHRGWSCDDVLSFEIVLANGNITEVTHSSEPELYWALRGGGNNFGIVTQMTIATFERPPSYYSFNQWKWAARRSIFQALEKDTENMPDGVSMIATTIAWHPRSRQFVISERYIADSEKRYTSTIYRESKPEQQSGFWKSTLAMAEKMDRMNPDGYFNLFGSMTVHNNAEVFVKIADIFRETMSDATTADDIELYTVFNPLTSPTIAKMQQRGGNSLGIFPDDGALVVINFNMRWSNASDNMELRRLFKLLIERSKHAAKEHGAYHRFIFQNHAFEEEDVFGSYGLENLRRLRQIRQKVDPEGVFQILQPGYFKL